jgi:hypothetical protein
MPVGWTLGQRRPIVDITLAGQTREGLRVRPRTPKNDGASNAGVQWPGFVTDYDLLEIISLDITKTLRYKRITICF